MKHSPTILEVTMLEVKGPQERDIYAGEHRVAQCFGITGGDWAQMLVRQHNAHDKLVAALTDIGSIKVADARDDFLQPAVIALTALAQLE